jgi:hypothetical protein
MKIEKEYLFIEFLQKYPRWQEYLFKVGAISVGKVIRSRSLHFNTNIIPFVNINFNPGRRIFISEIEAVLQCGGLKVM